MTKDAAVMTAFHTDGALIAGRGSAPASGNAAVVLNDQRWPRTRARSPSARLGSRGVAAVFAVLAFACPAFAHEHPKTMSTVIF